MSSPPLHERKAPPIDDFLGDDSDSVICAVARITEKLYFNRFEEWNLHVFDCKTKQTRVEEVHWNWEFGFDEPSVTAICCS